MARRCPATNFRERALKGEHVTGIEIRYTGLDSGPVWTRVSSVPLLNDDGSVAGAISVVVDIDEQKRAQEKLAHAAEVLESQVAARTIELQNARALRQRLPTGGGRRGVCD